MLWTGHCVIAAVAASKQSRQPWASKRSGLLLLLLLLRCVATCCYGVWTYKKRPHRLVVSTVFFFVSVSSRFFSHLKVALPQTGVNFMYNDTPRRLVSPPFFVFPCCEVLTGLSGSGDIATKPINHDKFGPGSTVNEWELVDRAAVRVYGLWLSKKKIIRP